MERIDGLSLDIKELFCQYWRTLINWLTRTIENSSKHFYTHGHTEYITCKFTSGAHVVDTGSTFENLYYGLFAFDLKDLTLSHLSISETDIYNLCVFWEFYVVKNNKRSFDIKYSSVIDSRIDVVIGVDGFQMSAEVV